MKQVFVTGATRGIGRAIALAFAEEGYEVGFCYRKSEAEAEELARLIDEKTRARAYRCDLSDFSRVTELSSRVMKEMSHIDVWINNAAVSLYGLVQDVTEEEFDSLMNVNFKSAFFLTRAVIPQMLSRKSGCVINLSSVWGQTGASCEVLYSASKAAMIGFTKSLAAELAPSGIRVNAIAPGVADTDMLSRFTPEEKKELAASIPTGRFVRPEEVASCAIFLASDAAASVTGQVLAVNGGFYR